MRYRREIYEKTLVSLAELRKSMKEDETPVLDFIGAADAEKGARDCPVPPEPLTLDELREMNAPVWCSCKPVEGGHGFWCLCKCGTIITPAATAFDAEEIQHWVLYRRPPEEEDKHGDYHPVMNR